LPCDARGMDATTRGQELLDAGLQSLRDLLGSSWKVELGSGVDTVASNMWGRNDDAGADALVHLYVPNGGNNTRLLVEAKTDLKPAEIERGLLPKLRLLKSVTGEAPALVVAPWISPRSRELLTNWGVGYLDLTGNVSLRLERSGVILLTQGASRDPRPAGTGRRQLSGLKAARLVRLLVDVAPPYRTSELAIAAGISVPYASRLLTTMEEMALINRNRNSIVAVDWEALLRIRAQERSLFQAALPAEMLSPNGQGVVLKDLRSEWQLFEPIALTGPIAAAEFAPVAVGGQLMLYVGPKSDDLASIVARLGLLPVDQASDILLLRAGDDVVFERRRFASGLPRVALSQLALDCLGGPGRMPEAGEAVLERMSDDEPS
jgi:hypothetical protein